MFHKYIFNPVKGNLYRHAIICVVGLGSRDLAWRSPVRFFICGHVHHVRRAYKEITRSASTKNYSPTKIKEYRAGSNFGTLELKLLF